MEIKGLIALCSKINVHSEINEKTAPLTSIKVGNVAKIIIYPHSIDALCEILFYVKSNNIKFCVVGNGTNVYFCDEYNGAVIVTTKINNISITNETIVADCGATISRCARMSLYHCLSGLEFAYGIPGTIGGALYMNAEAFGSRFSDIVEKCVVYDSVKKEVFELNHNELAFSQKSSIFSLNQNYYLLQAFLNLKSDKYENVRRKMLENFEKRKSSQPLDMPNAGSTFKRTNNVIPSKLIDECGLKGYTIGGAQISKKHAGFIVNIGGAKSKDIKNLIKFIKREVYIKFNQELDEEIIYIE